MKLSKQEQASKLLWEKDLGTARKEIEEAVKKYNEQLETLNETLAEALEKYNGVIVDCQGFIDEIASKIEGEINDRSEKWQEGDAGQAHQSWLDQWKDCPVLEEDVELPELVELEYDDEFIEEFANLSIEPEDC